MTKSDLREYLQSDRCLSDFFEFTPGQECLIYKAEEFNPGDEIIYIPDIFLNYIPFQTPAVDRETIDEILSNCYSGKDFIETCDGDEEMAKRLFAYCDWQHPSSAIDELDEDDEEIEEELAESSSPLFGITYTLTIGSVTTEYDNFNDFAEALREEAEDRVLNRHVDLHVEVLNP